jgi:hypothetical protein
MLRMIFEKSMETDANTAQPPTPPPAREMARRGEALRLGLPLAGKMPSAKLKPKGKNHKPYT